MNNILQLVWLIPLLPLVGFLINGLGRKHLSKALSGFIGSAVIFLSFAMSVWVFIQVKDGNTHVAHYFDFINIAALKIGFDLQVDQLSSLFLLIITGVGFLIHVYSTAYMHDEEPQNFAKYFSFLNLFVFSMLLLVLGANYVIMFIGWEGVGLCSYLLIGFWFTNNKFNAAARKAFVMNRIGDLGFLLAIFWLVNKLGTVDFHNVFASVGNLSTFDITGITLLLFVGATGKSAQIPLYTWLPDAMAGPTPVSSLLHSSTMVVAGVFLVARLYPVFFKGMHILGSSANFIVVIGGITIVIAALLAFVQTDIKKVLAYSTVSQLGYMMMGLGAGAWLPAVFHIFTHAFFKACLFLGAGSISHSSSHHSFEMKKDMGGLRKFMPITFGTWIISTLALCGVFPFSGFFSKDEIIDNVGHNGYNVFMIVGLAGAFLTAAYMTRATYLTFFGQPRGASAGEHHEEESHDAHAAHDDHADHGHDAHDSHDALASHGPHESGWLITAPLIILATLALGSGFLNAAPFGEKWEHFKKWVEPSAEVVSPTGIAYVVGGVGETRIASDTPTDSTVAPAEVAAEGEAMPLMAAASGEMEHESPCGTETPEQGVCMAPQIHHAPFKWSKAATSMLIVLSGFLLSLFVCIQLYEKKNKKFVGLTERNKVLGFGYKLLVNKYYLDVLYEKIIVHSIAHPIAGAVYKFNQKILDGVVNGAGTTAKGIAGWVYRNIDQRVVDGAVNGTGSVAQGAGSALRPVQSGKVNQYGALLFGAAAIGALVLVIVNT